MFSLRNDQFLEYITETSKPLYIDIYNIPIKDQYIFDDLEPLDFYEALKQNTKLNKLVLYGAKLGSEIDIKSILHKLKIPQNITTLGLPQIYDDMTVEFILPSNIQKLGVNQVEDLFKINFSHNNNLQRIKIIFCEFIDENFNGHSPNKLFQKHIDLSHLYKLEQIRFSDDCMKYKNEINKIMENVKLPYNCQVLFNKK